MNNQQNRLAATMIDLQQHLEDRREPTVNLQRLLFGLEAMVKRFIAQGREQDVDEMINLLTAFGVEDAEEFTLYNVDNKTFQVPNFPIYDPDGQRLSIAQISQINDQYVAALRDAGPYRGVPNLPQQEYEVFFEEKLKPLFPSSPEGEWVKKSMKVSSIWEAYRNMEMAEENSDHCGASYRNIYAKQIAKEKQK
jgi:hypothetical protein